MGHRVRMYFIYGDLGLLLKPQYIQPLIEVEYIVVLTEVLLYVATIKSQLSSYKSQVAIDVR